MSLEIHFMEAGEEYAGSLPWGLARVQGGVISPADFGRMSSAARRRLRVDHWPIWKASMVAYGVAAPEDRVYTEESV